MPGRFDPLAYRDPAPNRSLIRALEPVSRALLHHLLRVRPVEIPAPDLARLRAAMTPGTAAFLAPLHPEFLTDWLIDKEIAARVSPLMAHWASHEIVNSGPWAQSFWLANNLIANAPGGGGREYSVRWALQGHGVLLHPEGTATWHGRRVGPLLPGAVEMAWEATWRARQAGSPRPVLVVPLVWALCFGRDVWRDLAREMRHLERGLALPSGERLAGAARFGALQRAILARSFARFREPTPSEAALAEGRAFFDAQDRLRDRLLERLEQRHGPGNGELRRRVHTLRRAIRAGAEADPAAAREEREMLREIERLSAFTRECYGGATISQEEIAESLKRLRAWLLSRTLVDRVHNAIPVAVGRRTAHVRVAEPMRVEAAAVPPEGAEAPDPPTEALVAALHARMQRELDRLHADLAPSVDRFRQPNPFAV